MPRDARAYLSDIIEACDAIATAVRGLDLAEYERNRLIRSSVEREFITIGEAAAALARLAQEVFDAITRPSRDVVAAAHQQISLEDVARARRQSRIERLKSGMKSVDSLNGWMSSSIA